MDLKKALHIIDNPATLEEIPMQEISQLVADFPYCQTFHLLLQKRLQFEENAETYHNQLAKTACYASDSSKLFYWLTEIDNAKEILQKFSTLLTSSTEEENEVEQVSHPMSDDHTFGYWLKLALSREAVAPLDIRSVKGSKQSDLIDEFLQKNPSINPQKDKLKTKNVNLAKQSSLESDNLMTETLAQIYLDQGLYNKAIKAYEILSLKNPQKSSFFAQRIAQIAELKK